MNRAIATSGLVVVLATGGVLAAASCSTFGTSDPAPTETDGGPFAEASSVDEDEPDADAPPLPSAAVACGSVTCEGGTVCCRESAMLSTCRSEAACDVSVRCDEDGDCPAAGVCCALFDNDQKLKSVTCRTHANYCRAAARYRRVCKTSDDCDGKACEAHPGIPPDLDLKLCAP